MDEKIYHIVTENDLKKYSSETGYAPPSLSGDGFIHCTQGKELSLIVAGDYFSQVEEPLLILEINAAKCRPEIRFEKAAPETGGREHLKYQQIYPHIYGPLNLDAVERTGNLKKENGRFVWPDFHSAV